LYKILLVEDDQDLSLIAQMNLTHTGHQVDTAFTCAEARSLLEKKEYDLILLDVMLPDSNGDELCFAIRESCSCPIIFMSCLEDTDTIIRALHSGGDDYMVKPICYPELLARAEAVIRRSRQKKGDSAIRNFNSFTMDTTHHRILKDGTEVDLSTIEYALLRYMVEHPDTLLLYQDLYQNVWATDSLGDFRTVMVHISNIRKKIDPEHRGIIETVRGAGYIFSDV
jgi:DNA-binding response OmpR family regulator